MASRWNQGPPGPQARGPAYSGGHHVPHPVHAGAGYGQIPMAVGRQVVVTGIPSQMTEAELSTLFRYSQVDASSVRIPSGGRGYGIVELQADAGYDAALLADFAYHRLNGAKVHGVAIQILVPGVKPPAGRGSVVASGGKGAAVGGPTIGARGVPVPGRVPVPAPPPAAAVGAGRVPLSSDPKFTLNRKTQICVYWKEGRCTRGNACSFAHGESELLSGRPPPPPPAAGESRGRSRDRDRDRRGRRSRSPKPPRPLIFSKKQVLEGVDILECQVITGAEDNGADAAGAAPVAPVTEPISIALLKSSMLVRKGRLDRRILGKRAPRKYLDSDAGSDAIADQLSSSSSSSSDSSRSRSRRRRRRKRSRSRSRKKSRSKSRSKSSARSISSSSSKSRRRSSSSSRSSSSASGAKRKKGGAKKKSGGFDSKTAAPGAAGPTPAPGGVQMAANTTTEKPEIAQAKKQVLAKLTEMKNVEPKEARAREFRILLREWHPDKNQERKEMATAVFQFLQKGKTLLNLK